jgi:hypothetical protein
VSQEQKDGSVPSHDQDIQEPQQEATTLGETPQTQPAGKRRTRARGRLVNAEEVMPKPSLWPLALAFSIAVMLFSVLTGPVVAVIGAILLVASALGWILERR